MAKKLGQTEEYIMKHYTHIEIYERAAMDARTAYVQYCVSEEVTRRAKEDA